MSSSPMLLATVQACVLNAASNIAAQFLTSSAISMTTLDFRSLFNFVLYTALTVPLNFVWQNNLEETFPGRTTPEKGSGKLNKKNTLIKIVLDQTISASFFTAAYLAFMRGMKGQALPEVVSGVREDFWPLLVASWKVWPLVALLGFTLIPVEKRVLFASCVGFAWGIFLSLQQ